MATTASKKPDHAGGTYTFQSKPHEGMKFRDPYMTMSNVPVMYGNIMYDRRIVRGNTYAQHVLPATVQPDPIEVQRQAEARRRILARKRATEQLRPKSADAVEGRQHVEVQTELYLEEIKDRVEEADVDCQTDAFLDRPPTPLFVPAKTGIDSSTQILEGELFDFQIEVKPILEVLVGKTIEQALMEVMEEEELANLRVQQRQFEELRHAELVETQRLEEQERRHREEKERRMKQQREVLELEEETARKIAARAFAQNYLSDLIPSVFGSLVENGYFYDPTAKDVEGSFIPWLLEQVKSGMDKVLLSRVLLDEIIRNVCDKRHEQDLRLRESEQVGGGGSSGQSSVQSGIGQDASKSGTKEAGQDSEPAGQPTTVREAENDASGGTKSAGGDGGDGTVAAGEGGPHNDVTPTADQTLLAAKVDEGKEVPADGSATDVSGAENLEQEGAGTQSLENINEGDEEEVEGSG